MEIFQKHICCSPVFKCPTVDVVVCKWLLINAYLIHPFGFDNSCFKHSLCCTVCWCDVIYGGDLSFSVNFSNLFSVFSSQLKRTSRRKLYPRIETADLWPNCRWVRSRAHDGDNRLLPPHPPNSTIHTEHTTTQPLPLSQLFAFRNRPYI